jgi:hypothetical protein
MNNQPAAGTGTSAAVLVIVKIAQLVEPNTMIFMLQVNGALTKLVRTYDR